ncbi:MAG: hypothetical protein DRP75_01900 [Candidatus Omnitrophota bacterium]|nr:MAG: hypothetical protein DRP75_01900 [Candidatus Omnitrophota bacterium]
MKLSSLLHPHLIKVRHKVSSLTEVIREMAKVACYGFPPEFEKKIIEIIIKREQEVSTAMEGIAIPHAKIEDFSDLIVAISIPEKPIIVNNQEVKIFFLIITAKTSPLYLNVLSAIAQIRKNVSLFEKILSSKKPEDIIEAIERSGISVKDEFLVKDIMERNYPVVSAEDTLKTAIDVLCLKNSLFALVISDGKLLGEITLGEIIEKKMPAYVKNIVSLEFLKTFEPVEEILKDENVVKVKEVMSPLSIAVSPSDSIAAAVLMMVKEKRQFIPVIEEEKVVGMVSLSDFVKKVLRA